jgi:hypothetical protein
MMKTKYHSLHIQKADFVSDYEFITGKKLNHFVDGAAKALIQSGLPPVVSNLEEFCNDNVKID